MIAFVSCEKEKQDCPSSTEKTFANAGFTRISAGETFTVNVQQGTAFSIKAKGCSNDLEDLLVTEQNGVLVIRYNHHKKGRYHVDFNITMPAIGTIILEGAASGKLTGFHQQALSLKTNLSGTAKCTVADVPSLLSADLSGASTLNVAGTATDLIANLSGDAKLNAYTASFTDADVYTSGTANIHLQVQQSLAAFASGDSRIYYKGNPTNVNIEKSGNAKVIKE